MATACKLPLSVPREHLGEEIYLDLHLAGRKARLQVAWSMFDFGGP